MYRKYMILVSIFLLIVGTVAVFGNQFKNNVPVGVYQNMGEELKESIHKVDNQIQMVDKEPLADSEIAGEILGKEISVAEVEVKAIMYKHAGSNQPLEDAWNDLKIETYEYMFAEEHGLLPTEEEILEFTNSMRKIVSESEEGRLFEKTILNAIGMTSEHYWEVYKPEVESPVHLVKIRIAEYCEVNNLDWNSILIEEDIQGTIMNQELINRYLN